MYMHKSIACYLVLIFSLVGCAGKAPPSYQWGVASSSLYRGDVKGALIRRSQEVRGVEGRFWAKVDVGGEDRPAVRTEVYWIKDSFRGTQFKVLGLGPFSMTLFEARFLGGDFSLILPRDKVLYRDRVNEQVRDLFRYVFDPWGVSMVKGAQVGEDEKGNIGIYVGAGPHEIRALFKADLTPLFLEIGGVRVEYRLPQEISTTIVYNGVPIRVRLSISRINLVNPDEVLSFLETPVNVAGFRVLSLRSILEQHP